MITYWTCSGATPALRSAPVIATPPRSVAENPLSEPCSRPIGVRAPATMTAMASSSTRRLSRYDPCKSGGMKVYTRRGDDGTTGLLYGGRVPKDSTAPTAYGSVDEAQAFVGLARAGVEPGSELDSMLIGIERDLWVLMADIALNPERRERGKPGQTLVTAEMVTALEGVIDDVSALFEPAVDAGPLAGGPHAAGQGGLSHGDTGRGSTSSTRTPPASLGWMKFTRLPPVPDRAWS